jgi:hypothetical protein
MKGLLRTAFAGVVILLAAAGCQKKSFDGPTVDAFTGKVVADGKPVSFTPGEQVILRAYHRESGKSWGVPLGPDGTFKIGWMPIGTYTLLLERPPKRGTRSGPIRYAVPTTFSIVEGQTEYAIDLGKGYQP